MHQFPTNDRGTASEVSALAEQLKRTVSAVLAELSKNGNRWSLDRLKRLRDAGIIGDAVPYPGFGNLRFYEDRDIRRLDAVNEFSRRFRLQKLPNDEVAFWLAVDGDTEMPSHLVLSHIESAAERFAGRAADIMARRAGARHLIIDQPHPETIQRVATSLSLLIRRGVVRSGKWARELLLRTALDVFLTEMLRLTRYETVAKKIKAVVRGLGASEEQADAWAPHIWDAVSESSTFFVIGKRNAFVRAAREKAGLPSYEIGRVAAHAGTFYALLVAAAPVFNDSAIERQTVPLIAGMLLHLRENASTNEIRNRLDAGDVQQTRDDLTTLGAIVSPFLEKAVGPKRTILTRRMAERASRTHENRYGATSRIHAKLE